MILFYKKMLKRVIRITVLLSMLQELSWIIMIPSAEQKSVMFANFNKTIMRCQYYYYYRQYLCILKLLCTSLFYVLI